MSARKSLEKAALREAQKAIRGYRTTWTLNGWFRRLSLSSIGILIGASVMVIFGGVMLPGVVLSHSRAEDMIRWPLIDARVVDVGVSYYYQRYGGSGYTQEISYSYMVDAHKFVGDRVSFGGAPPTWPNRAQAVANLPEIGSMIRVRYNPLSPDDAVIHVMSTNPNDHRSMLWLSGGVGVLGAILLLTSIVGALKDRRASRMRRESAIRHK